jgi:hypothetical protein
VNGDEEGGSRAKRSPIEVMSGLTEPGWYPDPEGVQYARYWDGRTWTSRVADATGATAIHHLSRDFGPPGGPQPAPAVPPPTPTVPPRDAGYDAAAPLYRPPAPPATPPVSGQSASTAPTGANDARALYRGESFGQVGASGREYAPEYRPQSGTSGYQPNPLAPNPTAHRLRTASAFLRRLVIVVAILSGIGSIALGFAVASQKDLYGNTNASGGWIVFLVAILTTVLWAAPLYVFALLADGQAELIEQLQRRPST